MARDTLEVAFVVPRSGPAAIVGPSCEACGLLAVDEVNAGGGMLGREVRLRVVDGGRAPRAVAGEIDGLLSAGAVEAVTGWHISAVRQQVAPIVSGRAPYVYSPLYEGGERTPGVYLAGETPDRQLLPALRWMAGELGVRTWCVVGDDYVWPLASAAVARHYARRRTDIRILDEVFVPLGTLDFAAAVHRVERSGADGVLMLLVGSDAVRFNRAFAAAGLDSACVRLSPLMEENMVFATGAAATHDLYAASGYFEALPTSSGLDFSRRYAARFGVQAPVPGSLGESCYEGVTLLARMAERAGSLGSDELAAAAETLAYDSPRGSVRMAGNHLLQSVYLARADGLGLDVVAQLTP
ncbi:substrate-binding domain-containing protein [Pseudonocardia xinjiangensis]|uniref:Substrate-binding domain-containing protein n=1 Tax=Pseudonocardia xinjiangensis TaxID=75289 RepID=A0ABX1RFQ8_9PSEU|nr:substrate-binding domain-containing protein [Pseudonocardia xinjiangensis]NMH78636.1 substrate-binding domain-containing protein [Pseudonocardia xinjiangensis]